MPYPHRKVFLLLLLGLLTTNCVRIGEYRFSGAFADVQLPVKGQKIGILDPRGPYGNAEAKRVMYRALKKTLGRCPSTQVFTEDGMNDRGELPPIYGDQLSEDNFRWFVEQTTMDFLILLDVGPGKMIGDPPPPKTLPANQEVSAVLTVYDLNHGGIFKEIIVNGSLDFNFDQQLWERDASLPEMGNVALERGLRRLQRLSDCW